MHVAHGSHNVSEANRRTHNVHDRPLAGWILHDGRLVEQYDCRCRSQSKLPLANDTLSLCVAHGLRRPEFAECPAIKVEHSDERTGIVSSPCGIESDEQRGHGLGLPFYWLLEVPRLLKARIAIIRRLEGWLRASFRWQFRSCPTKRLEKRQYSLPFCVKRARGANREAGRLSTNDPESGLQNAPPFR